MAGELPWLALHSAHNPSTTAAALWGGVDSAPVCRAVRNQTGVLLGVLLEATHLATAE